MNEDTVDKVLAHLMTRGIKVAGGDRLGKTIVFAKNHAHALYIAERFDANYPRFKGDFARVIDNQITYADSLIEDFEKPAKAPHIAVSVDMLDTGIDIPEVVNLVFFKIVRSKTKFWQMVGRGTRLSPDLFGPGQHKEFFYLFDYCDNLAFFGANMEGIESRSQDSLSTRLFKYRLELIEELDRRRHQHSSEHEGSGVRDAGERYQGSVDELTLRLDTADRLRSQVEAMNVDNFIVRPQRRLVEKWRVPAPWQSLSSADLEELARELSALPTELPTEEEEAKLFDSLMLRLQLAQLQGDHRFLKLAEQLRKTAALLEEKKNIPMIRAELPLILEIQTDEWWQDTTVAMFENVRKRLRSLVCLIEKKDRRVIYTDFEDEMGDEVEVALGPFASAGDFERFRAKARQFLREHESHVAVHKVRNNKALTSSDLEELERILLENGIGSAEELHRAAASNHGLGLFVRSLVGLDRGAAKEAFAGFLTGKTLTANQIEFVNLIIDHLTENGAMNPALLYASPYTDFSPHGLDGVFASGEAQEIVSILRDITTSAAA